MHGIYARCCATSPVDTAISKHSVYPIGKRIVELVKWRLQNHTTLTCAYTMQVSISVFERVRASPTQPINIFTPQR